LRFDWADNQHLVIPTIVGFIVIGVCLAVMIVAAVRIMMRAEAHDPAGDEYLYWSHWIRRNSVQHEAERQLPRSAADRRASNYAAIILVLCFLAMCVINGLFANPSN
jgi:hypothetical protein